MPKALEELRRRGWSLAILSNIDHALMVESEKRLGVPFDLIVTAEDVRSYKPAPGHWERFFETTTADKERHVHVGASAFHDVAPAKALGLKTVWISRRRRRLLRAHGRRRARPGAAGPLRPARRARRARAGVTLRPPRDDEFDAMLELMNAHQLAAFGEADYTADDLRTWLTTPYVEVDRDIRVLERDGRLIGYADADPTRDEPPLWWCDVKVAPDVDADAVVAELVAWLEERAVEGRLRVWTSEDDARIVGAFDALGFEPVRHSYRMEIDLDDELREPAWPAGISVRTATADDQRSVYDAVIEVWQDTNDPIDETFEEWAHWHVERDSYDPSLWFLAMAGDELAGFSICRSDPVDPQRGLRQPARRAAGLAAAGSRRGAAAPLVRGVPAAWPDARHARRRRVEPDRRDPAVRAGGHARLPRHGLSRAGRAGVGCPREPPARPLSRLPHADRGRARARSTSATPAAASSPPGSSASRAPGATAARRWPRRRISSCPTRRRR